jgi:hypothetical protein
MDFRVENIVELSVAVHNKTVHYDAALVLDLTSIVAKLFGLELWIETAPLAFVGEPLSRWGEWGGQNWAFAPRPIVIVIRPDRVRCRTCR